MLRVFLLKGSHMHLHVEEMTPEDKALCVKRSILREQLRKESKEANDGVVCCAYCQRKISKSTTYLSHIIPNSRGGETVADNVVLSCSSCCSSKQTETLEEWCSRLMVMQGEIQQLMTTRAYKAEKPAA